MQVWLNGALVDHDTASVSVFDAGFQHDVGLFETMLARNGRVFRAGAHLARLAASAATLRLVDPLHAEPLAEAVQRTVEHNELMAARIRLTVTGGNLNTLQSKGEAAHDPTILIVVQPPTAYPDDFFRKGIVATVADTRANPLDPMAGHKTLHYWPRISALQAAATKGAGEALWFTVSNHLASGSVSNVFLVKDGALLTPIARGEEEAGAIGAPVLPGITRSVIIELARAMGLATTTKMLDINDVLGAEEVFLTNSSWGVLPVVGLEREKIGAGEVGEHTSDLRLAWQARVEEETRA